MRVIITKDYDEMSVWAANYVAQKIIDFKPTEEHPFVLGCPTGSSPLGLYKHLVELNKKGVLSFKNVVTFNMDPRQHRWQLPTEECRTQPTRGRLPSVVLLRVPRHALPRYIVVQQPQHGMYQQHRDTPFCLPACIGTRVFRWWWSCQRH